MQAETQRAKRSAASSFGGEDDGSGWGKRFREEAGGSMAAGSLAMGMDFDLMASMPAEPAAGSRARDRREEAEGRGTERGSGSRCVLVCLMKLTCWAFPYAHVVEGRKCEIP